MLDMEKEHLFKLLKEKIIILILMLFNQREIKEEMHHRNIKINKKEEKYD